MSPLYLGANQVDKCYLGANEIDAGMLGADEVCGDTNLIVNGTFDSDLNGWIDVSSGFGSALWNSALKAATITAGAFGNPGRMMQSVLVEAGVEYSISVELLPESQLDYMHLIVGTSQGGNNVLDTGGGWGYGTNTATFTTTASEIWVQIDTFMYVNTVIYIDNVHLAKA